MSSTLYRSASIAPVISLAAARERKRADDTGATLMVRLHLIEDDAVYRWVGIDERTPISDCRRVVATVFAIEDGTVGADASGERELREVLTRTGDATVFSYGLWQFGMQLADVYARDDSTPPSVCVAGSGSFGGREFNIAQVNAELMGAQRVRELRSLVREDVREVIGRATTHDFVPLIQALGVERGAAPGADPARLATLPLEADQAGRDAFWSCVLAAACCANEATTEWLAESIMASLGWPDLAIGEIRALCGDSLAVLNTLAAGMSVEERLDIYRDLLRG